MPDRNKRVHRPERLKGYGYSRPGCYFITFNTKARGKNILCKVVKAERGAETSTGGAGPTSVPKIIHAVKALTARELGESIWQDHYYDHIIRNDEDLQITRQYIQNNPLKWILGKGS